MRSYLPSRVRELFESMGLLVTVVQHNCLYVAKPRLVSRNNGAIKSIILTSVEDNRAVAIGQGRDIVEFDGGFVDRDKSVVVFNTLLKG